MVKVCLPNGGNGKILDQLDVGVDAIDGIQSGLD